MNGKRVVVTGVGVISSLGSSPGELYRRLRAGESGVRIMEEWSGTEPPPIAAPVNLTAEMEKTIPRSQRRSMGRLGLFSALAARSAVEQVALAFLLPLGLALVHTAVGMKAANDLIAQAAKVDSVQSALVTALVLLLVYGGYFLATSLACRRLALDR